MRVQYNSAFQIQRWIFLFFALAFTTTAVYPQSPSFLVRELGKRNNLEHNSNNAFISTDSRGFHWIGSSSGCYRYDGLELKYFPLEGDIKVQTLIQSDFFEDKEGNIWFNTVDGLHKHDYKTDNITSLNLKNLLPDFTIGYHLFHLDKDEGILWLSNIEKIVRFNIYTNEFSKDVIQTQSIRYEVIESNDGDMLILGFPWLMKSGLELTQIADGEVTNRVYSKDPIANSARIGDAVTDSAGKTWMTSNIGLIEYDSQQDKVLKLHKVPGLESQNLWSIIQYESRILVSTQNNGIWVFDTKINKFIGRLDEVFRLGGEIPSERIRILHCSPNGVIIGMRDEGGVNLFIPKERIFRSIEIEGKPIFADAIHTDADENIWIAHTDGRISVYDDSLKRISQTEELMHINRGYATYIHKKESGSIVAIKGTSVYELELHTTKKILTTYVCSLLMPPSNVFSINDETIISNFRELSKIENNSEVRFQITDQQNQTTGPFVPVENDLLAYSPDEKWIYIVKNSNNRFTIFDSIEVTQPILSAIYDNNENSILLGTTDGILSAQKKMEKNQ